MAQDEFPQLRADFGDDAIVHFEGSYKFLSSFADTPVVLDGVAYPTAEHAFQAQKTTDAATRARIVAARTPKDAQKLARKMPEALVTPGWFDGGVRDDAMKKVIDAKVRPGRGCLVCAALPRVRVRSGRAARAARTAALLARIATALALSSRRFRELCASPRAC